MNMMYLWIRHSRMVTIKMVSPSEGLFDRHSRLMSFYSLPYLQAAHMCIQGEYFFTGLNNFEINSIVDIAHDEQFGF